jgi:hypothetical protein
MIHFQLIEVVSQNQFLEVIELRFLGPYQGFPYFLGEPCILVLWPTQAVHSLDVSSSSTAAKAHFSDVFLNDQPEKTCF